MKAVILFLSLFSTALADTNLIPALTIQGVTYKNVELGTVSGSKVTIFYDGGGQRVAISNLPANLQKQLNFDPDAARGEDAMEAKKAAAKKQLSAEQSAAIAKAAGTLGPSQRVRIIKLISGSRVQIADAGILVEAYIHNLPYSVVSFLQDYQATKARVEGDKRAVYADRSGRNSGGTFTRQADQAADREHLVDLGRRVGEFSLVVARPSAYYVSPGVRQWEFQGMPAAIP